MYIKLYVLYFIFLLLFFFFLLPGLLLGFGAAPSDHLFPLLFLLLFSVLIGQRGIEKRGERGRESQTDTCRSILPFMKHTPCRWGAGTWAHILVQSMCLMTWVLKRVGTTRIPCAMFLCITHLYKQQKTNRPILSLALFHLFVLLITYNLKFL